MLNTIDLLLACNSERKACSTFAEWHPIWLAEQAKHAESSPFAAGVAAALKADRFAWSFFSGYQAAIQCSFPGLIQNGTVSAFCVQEPGRKITDIATVLDERAGTRLLQGSKGWVLADCQDLVLFVLARLPDRARGPGSLVVARLPLQSAGVCRGSSRPQEMVPELAHAEVRFNSVSLHEAQRVSGDGYADYAKPFRIREDICVTGCALAYLFAEAQSASWPTTWCQRCAAAITSLDSCSRLDPGDARTHIVTAGILSFAGDVIRESMQHWRDHQRAASERWRRDSPILALGREARRQRAINSWTSVGREVAE